MTDKQTKQAAINTALQLVKDGATANEAADQTAESLDVSGRTIQRWAQDAGTPLGELSHDTAKQAREVQGEHNALAREELKSRLLTEVEWLLDQLRTQHYDYRGKDAIKVFFDQAPAAAAKAYVTAAAILIDKMRLEEGKATGRTEVSVEQAAGVIEKEIMRLEAEMSEHDS